MIRNIFLRVSVLALSALSHGQNNPALKEHLMKTQAAVSMHLEHAKQLQAKIK